MSDRYAVLRIPDVRRFLGSRFFITLGQQMLSVVVGWQVYTMTRDPFALGMIGLAEALPYMGFLLWAGHYADRVEKRSVIVAAQSGLLGCAAALLALTRIEIASPWPIYAVIGVSGLCRSFLWPASASYLDITVPSRIYTQAAAWNSTLWQIGAILGPLLGGWLYAARGSSCGYAAAVAALCVGVWFSTRLTPRPGQTDRAIGSRRELAEGVRFVFSRQALLGALALDMFAVFFGGAVALLPVFAERLGSGASGLGLLKAAPAAGAVLMALYQSYRPPFTHTGRAMLAGVAAFGVCMILFPLSSWFWVSWALLAVSGMADNVSVVVRASILQAMTPNRLRGRVSAVNGMFISSSNEIGAFESGVAAKLLGTVPSVIFGGCMTLLCVAVTAWKAPQLLKLRLKELQPPDAGAQAV